MQLGPDLCFLHGLLWVVYHRIVSHIIILSATQIMFFIATCIYFTNTEINYGENSMCGIIMYGLAHYDHIEVFYSFYRLRLK